MTRKGKGNGGGRWDPFNQLNRISERLEELAENMDSEVQGDFVRPMKRDIRVDVVDEDEEVVVLADLPGFGKDDIEIACTDDTLTVSAEYTRETELDEDDYVRRERIHETVKREVRLPSEVEPEGAKATFDNGVLEVRLPKTEKETGTEIDIE